MDAFEGYTGIFLGDGHQLPDFILLLIIALLSLFAFVFRFCYSLIEKMIQGLFSMKERQNLFDTPTQENFFFNGFMGFQTLLLVAVFFFLAYCRVTEILCQDIRWVYILPFVIFIILFLLYLLKQCLYFMYGRVFTENGKYKLWTTNYHTLFSLWGILLYLPVLWLIFDKNYFTEVLILFVFSYILFRFAVIYVKIRIFYTKNTGLLYFSLYLCAQEIIPLLFLYESLNYLHNVIETSILWQ